MKKIYGILTLLLLIPSVALGAWWGWGSGINNKSNLSSVYGNSLITAANSLSFGKTLEVSTETALLDSNITISNPIEMLSGGKLRRTTGGILHIADSFVGCNSCIDDPNNDWVKFDINPSNGVRPEWFGCPQNSATVCTKYFLRAWKSLPNGGLIKNGYSGTYHIDSELDLSGLSSIKWDLNGSTLYLDTNSDCTLVYGLSCHDVEIYNGTINGNRAHQVVPETAGWPHIMPGAVIFSQSYNLRIHHMNFLNCAYALSACEESARNIIFSDNYFDNCGTSIDTYGVGYIITNNIMEDGDSDKAAIQIEPYPADFEFNESIPYDPNWANTTTLAKEWQVTGNTIRGGYKYGIVIHPGSAAGVVGNNTIANIVTCGINIKSQSKGVVVSGNTVRNVTAGSEIYPWFIDGSGICVNNAKSCSIVGNSVEYCYVGIVVISNSNYRINVTGNNVAFSKTSGICFYDCDGGSISNNIIYNADTDSLWSANGGILLWGCDGTSIIGNVTFDTNGNASNCLNLYDDTTDNSNIISIGNTGAGLHSDNVSGGQFCLINLPKMTTTANAQPSTGSWEVGQIAWNTTPSAGRIGAWECVSSGTFGSATDNTGDTDGSTGIITGMTDTSDFNIGDYVTVSAGFSSVGVFRIKTKTATSVTVNANSNSAQNNVTAAQYAPSFTEINHIRFTNTNSDTSTSGTGEDDLKTQSISANKLGTTGGVKILAAGTKTGSNGNKTIKLYFGTTSWTMCAAANNTNDWRVEAEICNTATNAQRASWIGWDGATPLQGYETATIDTTAAITLKITGECADPNDVVTQTMWLIERY